MPDSPAAGKITDKELPRIVNYLREFVTDQRWERINRVIESRTRCLNVVLEDLYQPHNASAVMRSCDAFGIQDLHVIEKTNRFTPDSGIAMGSEQWLTVQKYRGKRALENCLLRLKEQDFRIVATSPHEQDLDIDKLKSDRKLSLMFGSELSGLSDKALEMADIRCRIPMEGFTESFNISVSASLFMYELSRKLKNSGMEWRLTEKEKLKLRYEWLLKTLKAGDQLVDKFLRDS
ncbi:MAG: RNA methyltransferase [Balneolaceae bacterium]